CASTNRKVMSIPWRRTPSLFLRFHAPCAGSDFRGVAAVARLAQALRQRAVLVAPVCGCPLPRRCSGTGPEFFGKTTTYTFGHDDHLWVNLTIRGRCLSNPGKLTGNREQGTGN